MTDAEVEGSRVDSGQSAPPFGSSLAILWRTMQVLCYTGSVLVAPQFESAVWRCTEYIFDLGGGCAVDASRKGNLTRRINHSDNPI